MTELLGIARLTIHPGRIAEFKRLQTLCLESVRTKDSGTLQYECYFNADETECLVIERYRDSDALLEHFANLGEISPAIFETCTAVGELCGNPSAELLKVLEGSPVRIFSAYDASKEVYYHGTKADFKPGDMISVGQAPNYGDLERKTTYVYLSATLDAATWGAELALGEGRGRIYIVEPTGPIMDDPNLTDKKFPGNPTKSYRSREPLRVIGEVMDWKGHDSEMIERMKEGIERLKQQGVEPIDD